MSFTLHCCKFSAVKNHTLFGVHIFSLKICSFKEKIASLDLLLCLLTSPIVLKLQNLIFDYFNIFEWPIFFCNLTHFDYPWKHILNLCFRCIGIYFSTTLLLLLHRISHLLLFFSSSFPPYYYIKIASLLSINLFTIKMWQCISGSNPTWCKTTGVIPLPAILAEQYFLL